MNRPIALVLASLALVLAADDPKADAAKRELDRHQGTWRVTSFVREGVASADEVNATIRRVVEADHVVWKRNGKSFAGTTIELDPAADPKRIDVIPDGGPASEKRVLGIYKLDGDRLTICMAPPDKDRPTEFKAEKGSGWTLMTFRREAPKK